MRILAIETSGLAGGLAAIDGIKPLAALGLPSGQRSAQSLAPSLVELLRLADWRPADVQLVAVITGPGSFTGLRLGVTTAKTFAYAVQAHVVGLNTLDVIARQTPLQASLELHVAIDAQRNELYAARYKAIDGAWRPVEPTRIMPAAEWLTALQPGGLATGPALEKLAGLLPPGAVATPSNDWSPRAETVGFLAAELYSAGQRDDLWRLAPVYYRRSAAEEKADANARR